LDDVDLGVDVDFLPDFDGDDVLVEDDDGDDALEVAVAGVRPGANRRGRMRLRMLGMMPQITMWSSILKSVFLFSVIASRLFTREMKKEFWFIDLLPFMSDSFCSIMYLASSLFV
jgi:hypothetical protein